MSAATNVINLPLPLVTTPITVVCQRDQAQHTFVSYCPKTGRVDMKLTFARYSMRLLPGLSMRDARELIEEAHNDYDRVAYQNLYLGRQHQCKSTKLYCWYPEESDTTY